MELILRSEQSHVFRSLKRFNVLLAHRRFGKTVLAIGILIYKAQACKAHRPTVHYYAPSYAQAKKVAWAYLQDFTQGTGAKYNESELKCTLPTGAVIQLGSADNPDASRGIYSDFVVLDEPAQMPTRMWTEVLRPALSDRKGGMLMIGTPKGRHGLFYDSYQNAEHNDSWWRGVYRSSETGIIDPGELEEIRLSLSTSEYDQEMECDWSASIRGAYYGEVMNQIEEEGSITTVLHDEQNKVYCTFDLGVNDATAIWYFQIDGDLVNFIDYDEITNSGIPDIVAHMKRKPYNYGKMVFPFDVNVQSLATGFTRKHTLQQLGIDVIVAPKLPLIDSIDKTRSFLRNTRYDAVKCRAGLEALRQYRSDWDDKNGVLRLRPVHDFSSHGADSMRYLATVNLSTLTDGWSGDLEYADSGRH